MSYHDLARFFKGNETLLPREYKKDFLNAIYKHSLTNEEEARLKFNYILKSN